MNKLKYELVKNMNPAQFWGRHKHEWRKKVKNRRKAEADTLVCPRFNDCIFSSFCYKYENNCPTYRKAKMRVAQV